MVFSPKAIFSMAGLDPQGYHKNQPFHGSVNIPFVPMVTGMGHDDVIIFSRPPDLGFNQKYVPWNFAGLESAFCL